MSGATRGRPALALHGGCGVMPPDALSPAEWAGARADLAAALADGWAVLRAGGAALDAVVAAVERLENSPHFNAGHGAALNRDGVHELDAAVMDGTGGRGGAVCAARAIRNPVRAARAVMEAGEAVLLAGEAADRFAGSCGLPLVPQSYFRTERRVEALARMRARRAEGRTEGASEGERHGTVGAVALDADGHLAAATSTGGYTDKPSGRIGDSPVLGAGTYARDGCCAVSCTGQGEVFIRLSVAHEISARMRHRGEDLATASRHVMDEIEPHRVGAGFVAVDAHGTVVAPFNTVGMFRAFVTADGTGMIATHAEEQRLRLDPTE